MEVMKLTVSFTPVTIFHHPSVQLTSLFNLSPEPICISPLFLCSCGVFSTWKICPMLPPGGGSHFSMNLSLSAPLKESSPILRFLQHLFSQPFNNIHHSLPSVTIICVYLQIRFLLVDVYHSLYTRLHRSEGLFQAWLHPQICKTLFRPESLIQQKSIE